MQLVYEFVEFIEEILLLALQVLELLQFHFVLPLHITETAHDFFDLFLALLKFHFDAIVFFLFNFELFDFLVRSLQGLLNASIALLLLNLFLLSLLVLLVSVCQIVLQLLDDVKVCIGDLRVVLLDVGVLLRVLGSELLDRLVFLGLYPCDFCFALFLHLIPEQEHLVLEG